MTTHVVTGRDEQKLAPPKTRTLRCDFHLHTSDDQYDRIAHDVFQLIDRAQELEFDCLAVTNHLGIARRPDAEEYAQERGIILLSGVELTIKGRHVLCINPPEDLDPDKVRAFEDLFQFRRPETLIVPAHPFYPGAVNFGHLIEEYADLWDAIELCHFYTKAVDFNRRSRELSVELGLPLLATSDTHNLLSFGTCYSEITCVPTIEGIADAVRVRSIKPFSRPRTALEMMKVGWRTFRCGGDPPAPPGHRRGD